MGVWDVALCVASAAEALWLGPCVCGGGCAFTFDQVVLASVDAREHSDSRFCGMVLVCVCGIGRMCFFRVVCSLVVFWTQRLSFECS